MKIIDILNKIVNGETPKKVKYDNLFINDFSLLLYEKIGELCNNGDLQEFLNDEVEILEENKEIEQLTNWYSLENYNKKDNIRYANINFENFYEKIKELVNKVNELYKEK